MSRPHPLPFTVPKPTPTHSWPNGCGGVFWSRCYSEHDLPPKEPCAGTPGLQGRPDGLSGRAVWWLLWEKRLNILKAMKAAAHEISRALPPNPAPRKREAASVVRMLNQEITAWARHEPQQRMQATGRLRGSAGWKALPRPYNPPPTHLT